MTKRALLFFLVAILLSACVMRKSDTLFARENTRSHVDADVKSVGDAKRSLERSTLGSQQYPWYSVETDGAAFVPFPKEREQKPPREHKPREPREPGTFWNFFAGMSYSALFVIGLLAILVILVLAWFVLFRNRDLFRKLWKKEEYKERIRRIETLPEEARDMFDDLIGAATRAFEAGQYRNALIYYFSHQLVWLDLHQLIRMHKGKTNHEYARELRQATELLTYYEKSMSLFESVYYGDHPITRMLFLGIWEHRHAFSRAVNEEKQRRDEVKQQRRFGTGFASHRDSLSLTVNMPETRRPEEHDQDPNADAGNDTARNANSNDPFRPPPNAGLMLLLVLALGAILATTGCRQEVQTSYVPPPTYDKSLNGISVFNDMITRRGHALRTGTTTNSYAKNGDVLIWFARQTGCPTNETVRKIESWLEAKPGRTFVYVGRAFESTVDYWSVVEDMAPTDADRQKIATRKSEANRRQQGFLAKPRIGQKDENGENDGADIDGVDMDDSNATTPEIKESETDQKTKGLPESWAVLLDSDDSRIGSNTKCDWFVTSLRERSYRVTAVSGDANWTDGIDAGNLQLTCFEDWEFADDIEPLLIVDGETVETKGDPQPVNGQTFVGRKKIGRSQAIFVSNAGFLLNYPLVNHDHRKLAGRLIDDLGEPKKRVFAYIGFSELDIEKTSEVSDESPHVLLTLLHIWPLSIILCHVIVLCAAFCFYKWPIFGRPKRSREIQVADFSKHIDAYAAMLAEAKDDDYAIRQITEAYDRQRRT